jgi:two-component system phosphate regulon sensor histidine kinase PhoR
VVRPIIASHHCTVTLDEIERARVRADRDALHRVMLNLLENAVVHGGDGIAIHLSGHPADGGYEITVRDTGRGIPSEHQARIFERFYRVDRGRSRERGGSGLGLALVKHIVHEHGGSVDVASTVGRGSTFRFWLPLANGGAPAATSQENGIVHD